MLTNVQHKNLRIYSPAFNLDKGGSYRPVSQPHIKRFYHKMNDWCSLISLKMTQFTLIKPWRMSYLGPLGRGSHFRGWRNTGPAWVGTGRAEPRAVWYSFVVMGERMDISVVLSFHHSTECTPKHRRITFQMEIICIMTNISHRKLANPSFILNRCIYLLSRLKTSVLVFLKQ